MATFAHDSNNHTPTHSLTQIITNPLKHQPIQPSNHRQRTAPHLHLATSQRDPSPSQGAIRSQQKRTSPNENPTRGRGALALFARLASRRSDEMSWNGMAWDGIARAEMDR